MTPTLTTMQQPTVEKGAIAARLLIDSLIEGKEPDTKVFDIKLIIKNSTGPVKPE